MMSLQVLHAADRGDPADIAFGSLVSSVPGYMVNFSTCPSRKRILAQPAWRKWMVW